MADANTIKDYLVKLGFNVDQPGFDKFRSILNEISSKISDSAQSFAKQYVEASATVIGAISAVTEAIIAMGKKVAESDMTYQLFAQRMLMSNEAAKVFKITTDALGKSLNEIAWNPELRERYFELSREVRNMQVPENVRQSFRGLRDLGFEWTRMKVEALTAMDWITFHLIKLNHGELKDFKGSLSYINDNIQRNMPQWTEKVARFFNPFIQLAKDLGFVLGAVFNIGKKLFDLFESGWGKMPFWQKNVVLFLSVLTALFTAGALGGRLGKFVKGITLVTTALLLLDDALSHFQGKPSHPWLEKIWDFGEKIMHGFTKIIVNAMIAWKHFKAMINGEESPAAAWSNMMKDKSAFEKEYDLEAEKIKNERESSKRYIEQAQINYNKGGVEIYNVPPPNVHGLSGSAVSKINSYDEMIQKAALENNISPELLKGLMYVESRGNYKSISPKGALGLMQIMPSTAEAYGVSKQELFDPRKNIYLSAKILRDEINAGGSVEEGLRRYNAGGNFRRKVASGRVSWAEVENYQRAVSAAAGAFGQGQNAGVYNDLSHNRSSNNGSVTVNQGAININVTNSGASAQQISREAAKEVARANKETISKLNMALAGGVSY